MRLRDRPNELIAVVLTLVIAGVVGLAIPLIVSRTNAHVTPPPHARNGVTNQPTATAVSTATRPLSLTPATLPARQSQGGQSEGTATDAVEAMRLVSPTTPPRQPTASRTSTATAAPTQVIASATPTPVPTSTVTMTPAESRAVGGLPSPTTAAVSQTAKAEVAAEVLNLRTGPGQNYGVVARAKAGNGFTVIARSADDAWLQVCCVNESPAWLATDFVTVTGAIKLVPVAP